MQCNYGLRVLVNVITVLDGALHSRNIIRAGMVAHSFLAKRCYKIHEFDGLLW
jgi:hypothetical protein